MVTVYPGWFTPRLFAPFRAQRLEAEPLSSIKGSLKQDVVSLVEDEADNWAKRKARNDFFVGVFFLALTTPLGVTVWWIVLWLLNLMGLIAEWPPKTMQIPWFTSSLIFAMIILFTIWDHLRQRSVFKKTRDSQRVDTDRVVVSPRENP